MTEGTTHSQGSVVYFDGYCPSCCGAARLIGRLDWFGKFQVVSFRHDDSFQQAGLTTAQLERAMYVVTGQRALAGFSAVVALSLRLPLLWPLLPALWLAYLTGVGARLYRFLAERRMIVADTATCELTGCDVDSRNHQGPSRTAKARIHP